MIGTSATQLLQRKRFRFRRFSRSGWAVFRSLSLEVVMGTVATYIADRQLRKSHRPVAHRWGFMTLTFLEDEALSDEGQLPSTPLNLMLMLDCPQQCSLIAATAHVAVSFCLYFILTSPFSV